MKPTAEFHIGNFCKVQQMCQCLNPNLKTQRKKKSSNGKNSGVSQSKATHFFL